ncbi:MAG: T9SS type A sorting domain-containing protein, partial [Crocinitomicaceae bacterium]|nr:T9SS type A sorting domain-containing protein [Crocinitomicaceae bacterium]
GVDQLDLPFTVYPNPNQGSFTISHELKNPFIKIVSPDGRIVWNAHLTSQKQLVELSVSQGIYVVHVSDGTKTYLEKITIH